MEENRTLLTLEERLEMAAKSQAASPEAAARMVQRLGKTHTGLFFDRSSNLDKMYAQVGIFIDQLDEGTLLTYGGFCQSLCMATVSGLGRSGGLSALMARDLESPSSYRPLWGYRAGNAIVLLGLLLLDHAKGRMKNQDMYHCMRMTLEQYLDALVDVSFRADGTLDRGRMENYQIWRGMFLLDYDGSAPLGEVLAAILRRYITGWQEFDRLDHILRCIEGAQGDGADPACEAPEEVPDPGSDDIGPGALYDRLMLAVRDYSPRSLREQAAKAPSRELKELLEQHICEERLALAVRRINKAVSELNMLCVDPYLEMRKYHYEKHLK